MANMSDFHVVGDPRYAPDVPSGGGGASQEYVDNADINVKKTAAKGHNTKYDESVIPQDMNILYVYNNPQSMYPASEQGQESVFYETGKSQSLEYFNGTAERWTNRTYKSWTANNGLFALKWKYTAEEDPTYSNIRYHWLITSSKDKSVLFQHAEGRSVHDDVYAALYYEDQGGKYFGLYSNTNTGYYPTQPSYPQQVERDSDYFSSPMAWYSDFYTEIISDIWGMAYQPTLNFPIFDVTGSNFDAVNDYILHGQYINRSCAIDVITGDYYYIVNGAWVKQGTLDLNETGGTEVEANPQGTPTDTLNTIEIDGVIYSVEGGSPTPTENIKYTIVTASTGDYDAAITINKYIDDVVDTTETLLYSDILGIWKDYDYFKIGYNVINTPYWSVQVLHDIEEYADGYTETWHYTNTKNITLTVDSGDINAENVAYDNTQSGLSADKVQGAIDELADEKADKSSVYTKTETDTLLNAKANTADLGTASAKNFTTSVTQGSNDLVTSGAVYNEFVNLPKPEIFKGTLGVNGTITTLPTASSSNEGWEYKVITAGTYAGQVAKIGDTFISDGTQWVYIPSGDETDTDTWRGINVNGSQLLGNGISSGNVNFKSGTNAQVSGSGNDITIDVDTTFNDASSRVNIASGDSIKTILGKIKKWFADLKTVAFTGSYNDLSNTPTIPTDANYLARNAWWSRFDTHDVDDAPIGATFVYTSHNAPTTGTLLTIAGKDGNGNNSTAYRWQILYEYNGNRLYCRARNGDTNAWKAWQQIASINDIPTKLSELTNDSDYVTSSGTIANATNADKSDKCVNLQTVDLSTLDQDTWYPVTGSPLSTVGGYYYWGYTRMRVSVALNSDTKPSWSTHNRGFTVLLEILANANGWGVTNGETICTVNSYYFVASGQPSPCGYSQMTNSSTPVFWCRGGGKYHIFTDVPMEWTVQTTTYTVNSQSVSPTTTYPGVSFYHAVIEARYKTDNTILTEKNDVTSRMFLYEGLAKGSTVGRRVTLALWGVDESNSNTGIIDFVYAGNSNSNNRITFGFYSHDDLFELYPNGNASLDGNLSLGSSGSIASGDTKAVTGGTIYSYHNTSTLNPKTNVYLEKSGNVVNIELTGALGSDINYVEVVPTGYRPKRNITIPIVVNNGSSGMYSGELKINTDGTVSAWYFDSFGGYANGLPSNYTAYGCASYIV